jgi:CubicO group peptidase (beta-lactamase class C family)
MDRRIVALSLIVAFGFGPLAAPASAEPHPSNGSVLAIPPQRIDNAVASLDRLARAILRKTGVPGMSVAVVHDDKVVFLRAYGVRNTRTKAPVTVDTIFELASVSKTVGASVVAAEVGRGRVKWSDPVAKYIPGFTLADPWVGSHVTVGDMYAHRSGLPDHAADLLEDLGFSRADSIARLRYYPLDPFRITYHYTNFGMTAGAQAVANAAGMSWEQLSRERIYAPLGMTHTSSRFTDYHNAPNHADLHVRVGSTWQPLYVRDGDTQSPAGGVSSSARDMASWMRFELSNGTFNGKRIVDEKALLATRNPNLMSNPLATSDSRGAFYGYGTGVGYDQAGRVRWSHSGAFALGAATNYVMLPSEHLGIIVLTNGYPIGVPETLTAEFMDLAEFGKQMYPWFEMYQGAFDQMSAEHTELGGKVRPTSPTCAPQPAEYVGTYANDLYGPAAVEATNGKLFLVLGPKAKRFPLQHWNGRVFSYMPPGESSSGISAVTFSGACGTTAASVTIENLDEDLGIGTFKR